MNIATSRRNHSLKIANKLRKKGEYHFDCLSFVQFIWCRFPSSIFDWPKLNFWDQCCHSYVNQWISRINLNCHFLSSFQTQNISFQCSKKFTANEMIWLKRESYTVAIRYIIYSCRNNVDVLYIARTQMSQSQLNEQFYINWTLDWVKTVVKCQKQASKDAEKTGFIKLNSHFCQYCPMQFVLCCVLFLQPSNWTKSKCIFKCI